MTYSIGDEITLKVSEAVQQDYGTPEITEAVVTNTDPEDPEQPYSLKVPGRPYGAWLLASEYEIIETPTPSNDLDIAQVLVDYAANRLTLSEAVTNLKGLNA